MRSVIKNILLFLLSAVLLRTRKWEVKLNISKLFWKNKLNEAIFGLFILYFDDDVMLFNDTFWKLNIDLSSIHFYFFFFFSGLVATRQKALKDRTESSTVAVCTTQPDLWSTP